MSTLFELFTAKRYTDIIANHDSILSNGSHDDQTLLIASYYYLNKYQDALTLCQALYSRLSGRSDFDNIYCVLLRLMGKYQTSEGEFKQALANHPNDPSLTNNYCNLLVDQKKYSSASTILTQLALSSPTNIVDVNANISRLQTLMNSKLSPSTENPSQPESQALNLLVDPITFSYTDEEVLRFRKVLASDLSSQSNIPSSSEPVLLPDKSDVQRDQISLIIDLYKSDPAKLLSELSNLECIRPSHLVYQAAGDAYFKLNQFLSAEICYLNALMLGSNDPALRINLSTLAKLRSDPTLSKFIIQCQQELTPNNIYVAQALQQIDTEHQNNPEAILHYNFNTDGFAYKRLIPG